LGIEAAIERIASHNLGAIPDQITLPEAPSQTIELTWVTKSAVFDTRTYDGKPIPALVVTREYQNLRRGTACFVRKAYSQL